WLGQVVSELGNWFNFIAGLGLVRVVSGASPEVATILLLMRTAPFSLCALFAGALTLRWSRKSVLLITDLLRAVVALGFLLVHRPQDLWIAYLCTALLSILTAFFEAAKNAALPNVTGEEGLLAGNALMFSSRFLLMSLGAALGGWASAFFGYNIAFIINAVSFVVSAYSVWLVPSAAMHEPATSDLSLEAVEAAVSSVFADMKEGWSFIRHQPLVLTIIVMNVIWAIGGGAINIVAERLGGVVFAGRDGLSADSAVAVLYTAAGAGLFIGMILAHSTDEFVRRRNLLIPFIGWFLVLQGVLYAIAGQMPNLWLVAFMMLVSRVVLGVEYAVQETILMKTIPDSLRGRVMTTDRAAEISVFSVSSVAAGWSLNAISPQTLTVFSGLISGVSGIFWLVRAKRGRPTAATLDSNQLVEVKT
ncbi:MAG: MFS transporter, partial [Pyrinomonadaceae bacterium]